MAGCSSSAMADCEEGEEMEEDVEFFSRISEDILINIFGKLDDDPRYLARLACVCARFSGVIRTICWKRKCMRVIPGVVSDLLQGGRARERLEQPPGGWAALQKLAVCCPGLWHAGVLLESWDLGLERDIGPSDDYRVEARQVNPHYSEGGTSEMQESLPWSLFDDLHFDMTYQAELGFGSNPSEVRVSERQIRENGCDSRPEPCGGEQYPHEESVGGVPNPNNPNEGLFSGFVGHGEQCPHGDSAARCHIDVNTDKGQVSGFLDSAGVSSKPCEVEVKRKESLSSDEICDEDSKRRKREEHPIEPHLASGVWNLTREQGNKLLQSRFRTDSLYICDWPGCIHSAERRNYRLFRGIFKNFKNSNVWRNIKDMKAKKTVLNCAFCNSKGTWDMLTTFCLKRSFEYYDDGEPSVRAFVCENGHVSGAWTDRPMYN